MSEYNKTTVTFHTSRLTKLQEVWEAVVGKEGFYNEKAIHDIKSLVESIKVLRPKKYQKVLLDPTTDYVIEMDVDYINAVMSGVFLESEEDTFAESFKENDFIGQYSLTNLGTMVREVSRTLPSADLVSYGDGAVSQTAGTPAGGVLLATIMFMGIDTIKERVGVAPVVINTPPIITLNGDNPLSIPQSTVVPSHPVLFLSNMSGGTLANITSLSMLDQNGVEMIEGVIYVSGGLKDDARKMLDGNPNTSFLTPAWASQTEGVLFSLKVREENPTSSSFIMTGANTSGNGQWRLTLGTNLIEDISLTVTDADLPKFANYVGRPDWTGISVIESMENFATSNSLPAYGSDLVFRGPPPYTDPGYVAMDEQDGNITEYVAVEAVKPGGYTHPDVAGRAPEDGPPDPNAVTDFSQWGVSAPYPTKEEAAIAYLNASYPFAVANGIVFTNPLFTDNGDGSYTLLSYVVEGYTETAIADDAIPVLQSEPSTIPVDKIDMSSVGSYTLTYNVKDANDVSAIEVTRELEVTAVIPFVPFKLLGASFLTLNNDTGYAEPGYFAELEDGTDLSGSVVTTIEKYEFYTFKHVDSSGSSLKTPGYVYTDYNEMASDIIADPSTVEFLAPVKYGLTVSSATYDTYGSFMQDHPNQTSFYVVRFSTPVSAADPQPHWIKIEMIYSAVNGSFVVPGTENLNNNIPGKYTITYTLENQSLGNPVLRRSVVLLGATDDNYTVTTENDGSNPSVNPDLIDGIVNYVLTYDGVPVSGQISALGSVTDFVVLDPVEDGNYNLTETPYSGVSIGQVYEFTATANINGDGVPVVFTSNAEIKAATTKVEISLGGVTGTSVSSTVYST